MTANREIKIYGTLLNATVNQAIGDANHNDALGYAYQIYDDKFGENTPVSNFQDNINRRVTAISYIDGITTIKNRAGIPDGVPYMFVVDGNSNLNGNVKTKDVVSDNISAKAIQASNGMNITGDVVVTSGDLSLNNGDLDVDGTASISGATTIGGTLDVVGATTISSPVTINSNLNVAGTSSFGGQMTANGINSAANVNAPNIALLRHDVDIINGDKTVEGSIKKAVDDLYNLLMGDPAGHHIDYDTLNEIATFIVEHQDFANALQALVNQNKADIVNLKAADTVLSQRITSNSTEITNTKSDVQHLTADVQNHEIRITNIESTNTQQSQDIAELKEWAHEAQLDKIEILRNEVERVGNELDSETDRLDGRIDAANTRIDNISSSVSSLSSSLSSLASRVSALEAKPHYWSYNSSTGHIQTSYAADAAGFYDTTV